MQQGKRNEIQLIFENCQPAESAELPDVSGAHLQNGGTSRSNSFVNGGSTSKLIISFLVRPTGTSKVTIPSFKIETDAGTLTVPEANYQIVATTVGNTGTSPDEVFFKDLRPLDSKIYVGEVFGIQYLVGTRQGYQATEPAEPDWKPEGLVFKPLKEAQRGQFDQDNVRYVGVSYMTNAMATEPGELQLGEVTQEISLVVGQRRAVFFNEPVLETYTLKTAPTVLEVQPLPPNAPKTFAGAVGNFTLTHKIVPEQVQVGEPITWTLELAGEGNWPSGIGVPARSVHASFRSIQPDIRNELEEDSLFKGKQVEDIVLIPTAPGSYTLGPVEFSYFDPQAERYETITLPATTVVVAGIAASGAPNAAQDRSSQQAVDDAPLDLTPKGENTANKPIQLPRDPIETHGEAPFQATPIGSINLKPMMWIGIIPAGLWVLIAFVRALFLDPRAKRRKSFSELKALRPKLKSASGTAQLDLQRQWREATRAYWEISETEPTPDFVATTVNAVTSKQELAASWRQLWIDSDKTLYSERHELPQGWDDRFALALEQSPKVRRAFFAPFFSRQAWMATFALGLLVATTALTPAARADEAQASYNSGQFEEAETLWKEAISQSPNDWRQRYNAGLAASQQGDWGEAWGLWVSALCLNPDNEQLQWNIRLAHTKIEAYDPVVDKLVSGHGLHLAGRLSPARWERIAQYAIYSCAAFLTLTVVFLYLPPARFLSAVFLVFALISLGGIFAAKQLHASYGMLAQPDTALIIKACEARSTPSDIATEASVTQIKEGTLISVQKGFLGWVKIELPNQQTGWTRKENIMPLYGPLQK